MIKKVDSKRWLGIMLVVLAVLVVGITATGYADPLGPTEQLSGPAVVGTLQVFPGGKVLFDGHCRGNPATFTATITTTPASLDGLRFNGIGSVCRDQPSSDVIVKNVVNDRSTITPMVVLLWVVSQ
jgi:hypothetical protein